MLALPLALSLPALVGGCGAPGADSGGDSGRAGTASACAVTGSLIDAGLVLDLGACGGGTLAVTVSGETVSGDGDWTVELVELAPTVGGSLLLQPVLRAADGGVYEGLRLQGAVDLEGGWDALWRQGYQSWSWSGVVAADSGAVAPDEGGEALPAPGGDGDGMTVVEETAGTSWWGGILGRSGGRAVLFAAASALQDRFHLETSGPEVALVWGERGDRVPVAAGEELRLDPLLVAAGSDATALASTWADTVAARQPPRDLDSAPLTGWATWYQFYSAVTEDDVRRNLDAAVALNTDPATAPIELFQIDDGWEQTWGVWTAGERFPSGMPALAADIAAAGMTPGLWMAPFYVARDTDTFRDHPDWWVRGDDGEAIVFTNGGTGDYAIIDATHPDAGAWMAQQVADRVAEGWTWLKLDFLYAGAQVGQRHDDVTSIEAWHRGMALLREAAGDAWILACGSPLLPSVGYAEQFRTGADIAFERLPDPDIGYVRWQARNTAARGFMNGRWWWNDPDQLLVRQPLSDDEVRGALVAQIASGGAWMLGDDLVDVDADRLALALDPALVALSGVGTVPLDPLAYPSGIDASPIAEAVNPDDQVPVTWNIDGGRLVGLLNLGTTAIDVDGPGGTELLSGTQAAAGPRALPPGAGEVWEP